MSRRHVITQRIHSSCKFLYCKPTWKLLTIQAKFEYAGSKLCFQVNDFTTSIICWHGEALSPSDSFTKWRIRVTHVVITTPLSRNSTQKICPRLEVSIVQHSSNGFLLGLWNLEGRAKKKLSPDVQLEETKIVQILCAPSTTRKNETGNKYKVWRCTILFEAMTVCGSQLVRHFSGSAQVWWWCFTEE